MGIIIGEIIHELVEKSGLKVKAVAEYINVSESTLYGIYKRESVDIDKLILFSKLFNKNLFLYYLNEEPIKSMFNNDVSMFQKRIVELENKLDSRNNKVADLMEIINNQKKVILFHEEKSAKSKK